MRRAHEIVGPSLTLVATMLTLEEARQILSYDPATGKLTWIVNRSRKVRAGANAGAVSHGYVRIKVDGKPYAAHRVAWLLTTGRWPAAQIDHINGDRSDNRLVNLREATNSENHQNLPVLVTNKSGYTGVSWNKARCKWQAFIVKDGRSIYLGLFDNEIQASRSYLDAKRQLHTFNPVAREAA